MTETIIVTAAATYERVLTAGASIVAASDVPAEGPWQATLSLEYHRADLPNRKLGGSGVEIAAQVDSDGTWVITVTPDKLPFNGTLKIG